MFGCGNETVASALNACTQDGALLAGLTANNFQHAFVPLRLHCVIAHSTARSRDCATPWPITLFEPRAAEIPRGEGLSGVLVGWSLPTRSRAASHTAEHRVGRAGSRASPPRGPFPYGRWPRVRHSTEMRPSDSGRRRCTAQRGRAFAMQQGVAGRCPVRGPPNATADRPAGSACFGTRVNLSRYGCRTSSRPDVARITAGTRARPTPDEDLRARVSSS